MQLGACTSIDNAAVSRDAGFDYIEENLQSLLVPGEADDVFALKVKALRQAPLPVAAVNCFLPGSLKCVGPDFDEKRLLAYVETAFRRAHEVGIRDIGLGSGSARNIPDGFPPAQAKAQMLQFLRGMMPLAEAHDIIVAIETLNRKECNYLNTLPEVVELLAEVNHSRLRLLPDLYHMSWMNESAPEIVKFARWISHVHVAEQEGRFAPHTGGEDFVSRLRALKEIGYNGRISYECNWQDFGREAAPSVKYFRGQLAMAGLA